MRLEYDGTRKVKLHWSLQELLMTPLTESFWPLQTDGELLETTCGDALRASAAAEPDRIALVEGSADPALRRRWTYAELLADSERTARALLTQFKPGEHIAVWSGNCPEWIMLQFGIALGGMVIVTVNPAYQRSELKYVLEQSRSVGLFYQTSYRGNPMSASVSAVAGELPALRECVCLDDFPAFLSAGDAEVPLPAVDPSDPVMIQYTSGTTGFPKGAHLHHYGITNNSRLTALRRGGASGTVDISALPLFHTGGCVAGVLGTVQTQGTLVLLPEFDPNLFLDLIEQERAEYTLAVPTMLVALLEANAANPRDLSSMRVVVSGGATVPIDLVKRIEADIGVSFAILFGQTETSPVITMIKLTDSAADKSASLGTALPHTEVKIVDPEKGNTLPIGETGEMCTRGFLVMTGYFENEQATSKTIDAEGWLHTGDLCSMDERGYCYVEGRLKEMIIRGGENIYPRELEERLFGHPAVAEVAVVGIPDERWGEQVAAFIRFNDGTHLSAAQLHDYMREHLAPHKTPKLWFQLDSFPLTASGKIQKFKLAELFAAGELTPNMD